ncbi:inositol phosphosphingolipid phospholipase NDAI_0A00540 [Naumovozyma dairenensis CBS 421]|uniref:Endonuclease/exonuclease/phosphatase domain-containing protein n=1 Tax=Naumovozyma dairenensis (strain ATCC 10597 / BCRC 20456 / CBS 421 / NBRC 0211 / NRRL Y-12639) TaxID=1071378 RepID=G0W324_NAUDC|nr:hypothetical protein NDAI_0A00540 [Naumovozyma dairenensis CBS 421]CCD22212.1 hypothetical protein NDAI_0A00540 [Naumovozyma dairenensis CBS 421]
MMDNNDEVTAIDETNNIIEGTNGNAGKRTQPSIKFLTLNTWGLKYVSKHRKERLKAIADQIARCSTALSISGITNDSNEDYDIIALQEIWVKEDWEYIVKRCGDLYPYHRIFYSGILTGPGLAILSKIPIKSTFLYRFPINGRPRDVLRGDWYVGKSIAITELEPVNDQTGPLVIMNSHMHAPYALTGDNAYECHRSCQAWDFSKLIKLYKKAGFSVVVVGDLNSRPGSLPHKFLTLETGLVDSWEQLHGKQDLEKISSMDPLQQLEYGCTTCDSFLNTWRSYLGTKKAQRLDYALIDSDGLQTIAAGARFTERIPNIGSFSDHFAYSCTLKLLPRKPIETDLNHRGHQFATSSQDELVDRYTTYQEGLDCLHEYMKKAQRQQYLWGIYFWFALILLFGYLLFGARLSSNVTFLSSIFWGLFIIVIAITGTIAGGISFLFGRGEIRSLLEVEQELLDAERHMEKYLGIDRR